MWMKLGTSFCHFCSSSLAADITQVLQEHSPTLVQWPAPMCYTLLVCQMTWGSLTLIKRKRLLLTAATLSNWHRAICMCPLPLCPVLNLQVTGAGAGEWNTLILWHICTVQIYVYTCIHTYMRTYIHVYIHTYIHTYIQTNIHTYIHTYLHTYSYTVIVIHTYSHVYIHCRG